MDEPEREETSRAEARVRLGPRAAHYGGGLVAGATVMEIFGDLETEMAIREGGDEGLCVAYDSVEFLLPLCAGDFIVASGVAYRRGATSRTVELEMHRTIAGDPDGYGRVIDPPELTARARGTVVIETASRVAAARHRHGAE